MPEFEGSGFTFGQWTGGEVVRDNIRTMPHYEFSTTAHRLFEACYDLGWVRSDFDWAAWSSTPDAQRLVNESSAAEQASVEDLERLLTMCIRAERYCEGYLSGAYKSGLLLRILRRAAEMVSTRR